MDNEKRKKGIGDLFKRFLELPPWEQLKCVDAILKFQEEAILDQLMEPIELDEFRSFLNEVDLSDIPD